MPIRLYNPALEPPNNECEVMDENQAAILAESGWLPAPEPEADSPAHVPEPVKYAPVEAEKPAAKKTTAAKKSTDS